MTWVREDEHQEKALDNRAGPFQIPGTADIMTPILEQIQEVEDVLWDIFDARYAANATGHALEILGAIVGEPVTGDTDEQFRLRISMKLRAILSMHKAIDFFELLALVEGATWNIQQQAGHVVISQITGTVLQADSMFRLLKITSADGVLVRFEDPTDVAPEDLFTWPSQDGTIDGGEWSAYPAGGVLSLSWNGDGSGWPGSPSPPISYAMSGGSGSGLELLILADVPGITGVSVTVEGSGYLVGDVVTSPAYGETYTIDTANPAGDPWTGVEQQ